MGFDFGDLFLPYAITKAVTKGPSSVGSGDTGSLFSSDGGGGLDQQKTLDEMKAESEKWSGKFGDWRNKWANVNEFDAPDANPDGTLAPGNGRHRTSTGMRFDELSSLYGGEVDRGMYDAGSKAAEGMSRRGMGDSGYAGARQDQIMMKAAETRAKAREAARSGAVGEAMQVQMGDLGALGQEAGVALSPYNAAFGAAQQQALLQRQIDAQNQSQMMGGLGTLGMLALLA